MRKPTITVFFIAVVVMLSGVTVPVLGTPPFNNDDTPDWESADERATTEMALADFNGDGWQKVTGEKKTGDGHARVFYLEHFPALTIKGISVDGTPVPRSDYCFDANAGWFSLKDSPADGAVVEVDYVWSNKLDLFAVNHIRDASDGREVIYFNTNDGLNPEPGWISGVDDNNRVCEAADFDNDGDVDVVVGGGWLGLKLYKNDGSGLESVPSWVCKPPNVPGGVRGMAWGDLDNDGYLELAVGDTNTVIGSWFYVFKNNGGILEDTPSWIIDDCEWAYNVAWGDIDADGDMDLAASTYHYTDYGDGLAYVFRNDGGALETSPCWANNEPKGRCCVVTWGDVNGDGELDLFKGISGWGGEPWDKYSDIYYSENWFLSQDPSWESTYYTHDMVASLADCDGDEKLDMICANLSAAGYFTDSGELERYPSWEYNRPNIFIFGLSMGDINGDGAFDIALGCDSAMSTPEGKPNLVFYNTLNIGIVVNNFRALSKGNNIILSWEADSSYAGFNLYRSVKSEGTDTKAIMSRVKLNAETIIGSSPYSYVDADVEPGTTYAYWLEAIDGAGVGETFGPVECTAGEKPAVLSLAQNAPNPATGTTTIAFNLPERGPADIRVYDISGRVVAEVAKGEYDAGPHEVELNVTTLANGVYVYRLTASGDTLVRKMVVAR